MKNKNLLTIILIAVVVMALLVFGIIFFVNEKSDGLLKIDELMAIIKTDKDYSGLSDFVSGFDPEIVAYTKLSPNEYQKIKTGWQEQGLADRIRLVDGLTLTDSTYWVELKNINDQTKGLRMIIDTKTKTSLLLMASLLISAGVGM